MTLRRFGGDEIHILHQHCLEADRAVGGVGVHAHKIGVAVIAVIAVSDASQVGLGSTIPIPKRSSLEILLEVCDVNHDGIIRVRGSLSRVFLAVVLITQCGYFLDEVHIKPVGGVPGFLQGNDFGFPPCG